MKKLILLILIIFSTFIFSQTKKKKSQTSSITSCLYCGKKFNKNNGYVVPIGTTSAKPYKLVMENIVLAREAGYSELNLRTYLLGIRKGEYYCSQKCTHFSGYTIENF